MMGRVLPVSVHVDIHIEEEHLLFQNLEKCRGIVDIDTRLKPLPVNGDDVYFPPRRMPVPEVQFLL